MLTSLSREPVPRTTHVLLADKPGFARTVLAGMLAETPGLELTLVPGHGTGIRKALDEHRPDVLVIDDRLVESGMPDRGAGVRVIVVGVGEDPGYAARAARLGAAAWVPKDRADLLVQAVLGEPVPQRPANRTRAPAGPRRDTTRKSRSSTFSS